MLFKLSCHLNYWLCFQEDSSRFSLTFNKMGCGRSFNVVGEMWKELEVRDSGISLDNFEKMEKRPSKDR